MKNSEGPCILSIADGVGRWLTDTPWAAISSPVAGSIGHASDHSHSWKIESVFPCPDGDKIRTVSEKDSMNGAYRFTYSDPNDAEEDDSITDWESALYE